MTDDMLSITVHLLQGDDNNDGLLGHLEPVVSRHVSVVFPPDFISALVEKLSAEPSLQVSLNQNVAEVRREFDALKSMNELGLLARTDVQSEARYIDSGALLDQRNPTIQKAYENMFRCALNIVAISQVFEDRTGEALPINVEAFHDGNP